MLWRYWVFFQVEDLNAKWQKYDASRDEYVKRLHLQLKDLKSQLEQQHSIPSAQTNSELMQKEILRLNKLLEEKMNECKKSRRELEDVKKAREGDSERIQMLEQQVNFFFLDMGILSFYPDLKSFCHLSCLIWLFNNTWKKKPYLKNYMQFCCH